MHKINNLQALRALATLSIVFFHSGYKIGGYSVGAFGVDVFFVISGFIVAMICSMNPADFLRRRAVRVVPLYWTATVLTYLVARWIPGAFGSTGRSTPLELVKSLLFMPYTKESGAIRPVLFVGWSLEYEIYFYVVTALMLYLVAPRIAPWLASAVLMAVLILCRVAHTTTLTQFYGDPIVLEFIYGIASFYLTDKVRIRWNSGFLVVINIAMLTILAGQQLLGYKADATHFVTFGLPAFIMVSSSVWLARSSDSTSKIFIAVGDASYMLYLLHPFLLAAYLRAIHRFVPNAAATQGLVIALSAVSVATAISVLLYFKIEKPCLRWMNKAFASGPAGRRPTLAGRLGTSRPSFVTAIAASETFAQKLSPQVAPGEVA